MRILVALGFLLAATACNSPAVEASRTSPPLDTTTTTVPPASTTLLPPTTTTIPPLNVAGKVIGPDAVAVSNARVEMEGVVATTGSDGFFDLLVAGPGTLVVTRPGWTTARYEWSNGTEFAHIEMEPKRIRGLRVGAGAAGDDSHFTALLSIAADTAVNALVFDSKQEDGQVLYETSVEEAHSMGAVDVWYDPAQRLKQAREAGLYVMTRIVVFEDPIRVRARPDEKLAGRWIDPRAQSAWEYNVDLAEEACVLGFDEIQFDYVRFPAGRTAEASGQLSLSQQERVAAIEGFLRLARSRLEPLGCAVSADIFAIVVSSPDDQGLGQRPEELSRQVDALSPMIYPSHYEQGWLGLGEPNDHPYAVTAGAIDDALPRMARGAVLRPWLQAFWWSNEQIRSSIQAAEDRDVGWILWNVRSNFDREAIPTEDEVDPGG